MRLKYRLPLFSASHHFKFDSLDSLIIWIIAAQRVHQEYIDLQQILKIPGFQVEYLGCECIRCLLFIAVKYTLDAMVRSRPLLFCLFPQPAFQNSKPSLQLTRQYEILDHKFQNRPFQTSPSISHTPCRTRSVLTEKIHSYNLTEDKYFITSKAIGSV